MDTTNNTSVAVCVPASEVVPTRFLKCLFQLFDYSTSQGFDCILFCEVYPVIHLNRNTIIKSIKEYESKNSMKFDYLFWLDSDTLHPAWSLEMLHKANKDIVGGVVFSKIPPHTPNIRKYLPDGRYVVIEDWLGKDGKGNIFLVDGIGFGCVLHKREIIDRLDEPYFTFSRPLSEDLDWCERCRKLGYEIWATTILNLHHGISGWGFGEKHYRLEMSIKKALGDQGKEPNESKKEKKITKRIGWSLDKSNDLQSSNDSNERKDDSKE